MVKQPLFIAVIGPTGSGKTALGIFLAKALQSEVISADSQLVYQGLDIGTGKPTEAEKQGIPHHIIDVVSPVERYTAARYRDDAKPVLATLRQAGKTPIVVGGTGLYVRALLDPPMAPEVSPNPGYREELKRWMATFDSEEAGITALHQKLEALDPRRASEIHPNNTVRVLRALEIIEATGKPVPEAGEPDVSQVLWLGLTYQDRDNMRARIDRRIQEMLENGWVEEIQRLAKTYGADAHALQVAHGYPELLEYSQGKRSLEDAISQIEINIHQYARRQHTWYRQKLFQQAGQDIIQWHSVDEQPFDEICGQALAYSRKHLV